MVLIQTLGLRQTSAQAEALVALTWNRESLILSDDLKNYPLLYSLILNFTSFFINIALIFTNFFYSIKFIYFAGFSE